MGEVGGLGEGPFPRLSGVVSTVPTEVTEGTAEATAEAKAAPARVLLMEVARALALAAPEPLSGTTTLNVAVHV
jgi:hypothetical protein